MNRGFKIFTGAALGLCRQALQLLAEAPLESGREEASSEAPVDVGE